MLNTENKEEKVLHLDSATSATLICTCESQSVRARTQISSFCTMLRTSYIKLLFTFSSLPITFRFRG